MNPRVLDVYCCQGGASRGYEQAGFDVTGVDIDPQPLYVGGPDRFIQADAVAFLRDNAEYIRRTFVFVHASPPCQFDSETQRIQRNDHPDLIGPTRDALNAIGLPWVIENVRGAVLNGKLRNPVMLCGTMFGLETYRHRYFEAGGGLTLLQPQHSEHVAPQAKMGRPIPPGHFGQFVGNFSGVPLARQVMDMPWANRDGLREAIPPAYARWVGEHVQALLRGEQVPASTGVFQPSLFDDLGEAS